MIADILAKVIRGDTVESVHRGHYLVIDGKGNTLASAGDPSTVTYFRSSCKSIQAIPFIASGAADRFGFSDDEIALAVASHSGERMHVEIAARMLAKAGFSEKDLRCGAHLPFNEQESQRMISAGEKPNQLHNNCSGKHAAMLALARHIGADPANYDLLSNPVQAAILERISEFSEVPASEIAIGIDGCAAPNFAVPVAAMARSFNNLLNPPDSFDDATRVACRRIVKAMIDHPKLVGGTGRLDTMIMEAARGALVCKVGADGVWLCGVSPSAKCPNGLTIALKIEDGDDHLSRPVVAVELLRKLGLLAANDLPEVAPMPVRNRRGDVVGRIEAVIDARF
ncbi:MAG: asparaginase [Pyrinomonadaceae bacterium]|nr:asparaginase [Pyrinomonadaceae bacterium]